MSELVTKPLGQLAKISRGITYTEAALRENPKDGFPYINMKSFLKDGGYNEQGLKYYSGPFRDTDIVKERDLLIANTDVTREGDIIGVPAYLPDALEGETVLYSHHVTKLSLSEELSKLYLFYLLCSDEYRRAMKKYARGTTVLMLDSHGIQRIPVNFHRVALEQEKIAHILQTIDRAIEHTAALIEKYRQIKAGLMHDLFTRGIGADGELRPPREQAPHLYKETPIGWIPKEWRCLPLRKMAKSGTPHLKTGPFGSSLKGEHWVNDGIPVITIGALGEGRFYSDELLFISELDAKRLADFKMRLGDVVFSRVADVGRSVVIEEQQVGWIMSSNLMRISLDRGLVEPHFLQQQLSFDSRIKNQIRCKVNAGGRDVANSEILNSILFIWPAQKEQEEIVNRSNKINARITLEESTLEKLQKQKSGLMHDLLTGKVSVTVDDDIPENTQATRAAVNE